MSENSSLPGCKSHGWWPRCPDLLTNAYTHTTHRVFYAAVLPPRSPGAICLAVPQWRLRFPAAQGRHSTVHHSKRIQGTPQWHTGSGGHPLPQTGVRGQGKQRCRWRPGNEYWHGGHCDCEMTPSERLHGYCFVAEGCAWYARASYSSKAPRSRRVLLRLGWLRPWPQWRVPRVRGAHNRVASHTTGHHFLARVAPAWLKTDGMIM